MELESAQGVSFWRMVQVEIKETYAYSLKDGIFPPGNTVRNRRGQGEMFVKAITILILCFTAGAMLAHAWYQPIFNELDRVEAELEAYRNSTVIGWVRMDDNTKQLYFAGK